MAAKKKPAKQTSKKAKVAPKKANTASAASLLLYHRIDALLHTVRCVAQHEDQLCTLLHAARNPQAVDPEIYNELRQLLEDMPSREYTDDLHALSLAMPTSPARATPRKSAAKKVNPRRK